MKYREFPFEADLNLRELYTIFQDEIEYAWSEHLSNMQDSHEHIKMLSNSDRCFWEWFGENYETVLTKSFK